MEAIQCAREPYPLLLISADRKTRKELHIDELKPVGRLYRCDGCDVWWGKGQLPYTGQEHLVFRFLEPYEDLYAWEDYRGWRLAAGEGRICPCCGENVERATIRLLDTISN